MDNRTREKSVEKQRIPEIWCPEEGEQEIENAYAFSLRTPEGFA